MKELIISIIIIVSISIGNKITQDYTKYSVEDTSKQLSELKEEILKESENEEIYNKMTNIYTQWEGRHSKLAYYIEHDELEKVETNLTSLKTYLEVEEYGEGVSKLDETIYILKHIEDKNKFNLENIF